MTFLWNVARDLLDRWTRVRVRANIAGIVGPGYHDPNNYLALHVTNVSATRDVEIRSAGAFETRFKWTGRLFRKRKGWLFMTQPPLPRRLEPAAEVTLMTVLQGEMLQDLARFARIAVFDTRDREYRISRADLKVVRTWAAKKIRESG